MPIDAANDTLLIGFRKQCLVNSKPSLRFGLGAWPVLVLLTVLAVPRPASASGSVRFEYQAPSECPGEAEFLDAVQARLVRGRLAAPGEVALRFTVTLSSDPAGASARVDFVDSDGIPAFRTIVGSTCNEVMTGIALVSALACDAQASAEESGEAQPKPVQEPAPELSAQAQAQVQPKRSESPAGETALRAQPIVSFDVSKERSEPVARASRTEVRMGYDAGAGAGYASHQGPSGALAFDAFFGVRRFFRGMSARASAWHFRSETSENNDGREARFRGYGLRLEGCPLALGAPGWWVEPCIGVDGGMLVAAGVVSAQVAQPRRSRKGFGDLVGIARVGSIISGWLLLELQGELALSLVRYRYGFGASPAEPDVFDVPALGGAVRAHVGVHFP